MAGDRVRIDDSGTQGIVREILPRRTVLERIGSGGRVRTVVANADLLVVIDREEDEGRAKVEAELGGAPLHALFTARELLAL